jgi:putative NADH-flavin reductase
MNLTVFGGTGGTGRAVIVQALERGDAVTALLRTPLKLGLTHSRLRVIQGDVRDAVQVQAAIVGSDAVVSALGAKPKDDPNLCSLATEHIIAAMKAQGVRRLVCVTGCMVGHPPELMHGFIYTLLRWLEIGFLKRMIADRRRQEALIIGSGLLWTIIRPPRLTDDVRTGRYRMAPDLVIGPGAKISRADVADSILRVISDGSYEGASVAISM